MTQLWHTLAAQFTWTEFLGFLTGAWCVWLLVKQNIWTWPVGIANNIFFIVLFLRTGIYGDMALQFFYIAISIYGWWNWLYGGKGHGELHISRTPAAHGAGIAAAVAVATGILMFLLQRYTNSTVPFLDALTTAMSLAAQYMQSRKFLENWHLWIAADVFYISLYIYKNLYLTALLYLIFLIMCIAGLVEWRRSLRTEALPAGAA